MVPEFLIEKGRSQMVDDLVGHAIKYMDSVANDPASPAHWHFAARLQALALRRVLDERKQAAALMRKAATMIDDLNDVAQHGRDAPHGVSANDAHELRFALDRLADKTAGQPTNGS